MEEIKTEEIIEDIIKSKEIEMNMLRDRADSSKPVTDEMWENVAESTRYFYDEYFKINARLSPDTLIQYKSALKIFFYYIYENMRNKPIWKIKKTDFMKYVNYLEDRGLSSSAMKVKRYAVSSFCNTMEILADEVDVDYDPYPEIETFRSFARVKIDIAKNQTYSKIPITRAEFEMVVDELEKQEDWYALCYFGVAFNIGARRSEMLQLKTNLIHRNKKDGKPYIESDPIRLKGKGRTGKVETYIINDEAVYYMKLLIEKRGFEGEFIFENESGHKYTRDWINYLFQSKITKIIGRRVTSHNLKNSCVTYMLEQGASMEYVSKRIAHHASTEVTSKFYDLREKDESGDDEIFAKLGNKK